jgi:hypothetical protein
VNDYDACKALLKIMDEAYGAPVVTSFPEDRSEVEAQQVEESFPMGVQAAPSDNERVSYSSTKTQGDAQLTVQADAGSMQELHDILKLAGINVDGGAEEQPQSEPEMPAEPEDAECDSCAGEEPERDEYTTDKQKIIDVIKARLANKLS